MFINDEAQKQVLPIIARTTVTPTTEAQQRAGALLQMNPGQQVKAEIIANLPNNLYLARVAGQLYKLEIPLNVQPGETMDLTFVAAEPRITFQFLPQPDASAAVQLSSMGKWLAVVVNEAPELAAPTEPLLENPTQQGALLAGRLKEALTQRGLFYESHLAQWVSGQLQLAEILKEPQGKLSRVVHRGDGSEEAKAGQDAGFADSRMLPLIKEQLHLLNTGILSWKGEAWPGQGLEISIAERGRSEEEPGVDAAFSLDLPKLGGVEAMLHVGRQGLAVEFVCGRRGASAVLKEAGDELRTALAAAGLHLVRLAVKDGETDD